MKNIALGALSILASAFLLLFLPTEADAAIYDDTLRLHVLANSDSDFDQSLKLSVRDYILETYSAALEADDFDTAKEKAEALIPTVEAAVDEKLREARVDYKCRVTLSEEVYDTRTYDTFSMPGGRYLSFRVILGAGEGKNWWCVMYPPMCLDLCTAESVKTVDYTEEEIHLIADGDYQIKFKLLEVASELGEKMKKRN